MGAACLLFLVCGGLGCGVREKRGCSSKHRLHPGGEKRQAEGERVLGSQLFRKLPFLISRNFWVAMATRMSPSPPHYHLDPKNKLAQGLPG